MRSRLDTLIQGPLTHCSGRSGRPQQLGVRDAVSMSAASDHASSSVPSVSNTHPSSITTGGSAAAANIVLPSSDPCTVLVRNLSVDLTEQGLLLVQNILRRLYSSCKPRACEVLHPAHWSLLSCVIGRMSSKGVWTWTSLLSIDCSLTPQPRVLRWRWCSAIRYVIISEDDDCHCCYV